MHLDTSASARITKQLAAASKTATTTTLDHFPPLIVYKCLSGTDGRAALAEMTNTVPGVDSETISMPRRGHGPRPVTVLSPIARARYTALVDILAPALPPSSRAPGNWANFRTFGTVGDHSHVVELDMASCYQFIDHATLRAELLLRSSDIDAITELVNLLSLAAERGRGLPQMVTPSDRLADAYLELVGRALARQGRMHYRYADDFRVLASSWDEANETVELAATIADGLGLILANHKTNIRLKKTVNKSESARAAFLDEYLEGEDIETPPSPSGPYGRDDFEDEDEDGDGDGDGSSDPSHEGGDDQLDADDDAVDELDPLATVYYRVLQAWHVIFKAEAERPQGMNSALTASFRHVVGLDNRIDSKLLLDLVFDDPLRMEYVCRYVVDRTAADQGSDWQWALIHELTLLGGRSPWSKLWILFAIEGLIEHGLTPDARIEGWILGELDDGHEIVRAQVAWVASAYKELSLEQVRSLYASSSTVSAPALAAVAGRIGSRKGVAKQLVDSLYAIRDDSYLNKAAFAWAQS